MKLIISSLLVPFSLAVIAGVAAAADFDIKNSAEFAKVIAADAKVEKLADGFGFTEGPVWVPRDGGFLVFSDIPRNQLKKWTRAAGVTTFREPSQKANGNTLDREGRLVSGEHGARRVSVTEKDGTIRTLVEEHDGKKLNSPNDVVVKSDGTIWFTDPGYGLEGRTKEQPGEHVYRFDPVARKLAVLVTDFDKPNGLCFSPDEKKLYVADSGRPRHIRVFDVSKDGTVANGKVFATLEKGGPDGIRCDADGRIWSSSGFGADIFAPDGTVIGRVLTPKAGANLCFGGTEGRTLFITARDGLYAVETLVRAASRP